MIRHGGGANQRSALLMVEFTEANLSLKTPFKTTGKGVRKNSSSMNKEEGCGPTRSLVQSRKIYTRSGVEQAMKNWEGKIFLQLPHTIPVVPPPHLLAAPPVHVIFCPPVTAMHTVTIMSQKAIIIIISIRAKSTKTEKQRYRL